MLIYTLPFIGAITGWVTNYLAVKMLFYPREPKRILGITIQGIFPKRQKKLAEKLGELVSKELFSIQDLKEHIQNPELIGKAKEIIDLKIDAGIAAFLQSNPMLSMFAGQEMIAKIKATFSGEIESALPEFFDSMTSELEQKVNIEQIVIEKVENFAPEEIEKLLYGIMKKEFKFIELVGAVLGFLIGCIQVGLVLLEK